MAKPSFEEAALWTSQKLLAVLVSGQYPSGNYSDGNQMSASVGTNHGSSLTTMAFHDTNSNGTWA